MRVLCAIALSFTAVVASTVRNGERLTQPVNDGEEHGVLTTRYEMFDYKPKAQDLATVVTSDGGVRITVLTDRLIRIEQGVKDEDCDCYTFEDRPSVAAVNRHLKVPKFETTDNGTTLSLTSDQWEITHVIGSDLDDPTGQSIKVQAITGDQLIQWDSSKRSSKDSGNLMGTFRTLDQVDRITLNCTENKQEHCEYGIISRSGWALLDDSDGPVMDEKDWWTDKSGKAYTRRNKVDWYLFLHGLDYTGAIFDYTQVFGRTSLLPKYSLGTWFTRWYDYNDHGVRRVVDGFLDRGLPLDLFVFDMNWHKKNGWTGYSWDTNLFPNPKRTLQWLKDRSLHLSANIHDADGIKNFEDDFEAACQAIGLNHSAVEAIDFDVSNRTTMLGALEDVVLLRLEDMGIDVWWIDWQQGQKGHGAVGGKMNPTIWTNKVRATDAKRRGDTSKRPFVLGRWGGHGTHRYPIGFSGDVKTLDWANLVFQPYFTMTSSNLGYGWWSHDITGPGHDHELYTRWIQWGAYSGILRLHERGMSAGACADPFPSEKKDSGYPQCAVVSPWKVPDRYFDANRRAMIDRARLIPYIYTQARLSFESGVSIIQPLYYHFPHHEHAYAADYMGNFPQYMFGSDMMISPVLVKAGASDTSEVVTWLPPGLWFSVNDGMLRDGGPMGKLLKQKLTLEEWGVYVRAGAIIPRIPVVTGDTEGLAQREYSTLVVSVYPGGTHGKSKVYEDDGLTMDHLNGDYRWTTAEYTRTTFFYKSLTFTVQSEGKYANMLDTRDIQLRLVGSAPPIHVYVNGKVVEMTNKYHHKHHHKKHHKKHAETAHTWHFDGDSDLAVVINAYDVQCNEQLRVYVVYTELFQADADTHTHTDTHTDTHVDTHVRIEAEAEGAGVGTHAQTHSGQADADAQTHAHTRTRAAHARARDTATDTAEDDNAMDTDTLNGLIGAVAKANLVKDAFDDERTTPGSTVVKAQASLIQLASLGIALEYAAAKGPKEFYKLAKGAKELLEKAKKEVLEIPNADANRKQFGVEVLNEIFM